MSLPEKTRAPTVVLIEDSIADVKITERALKLAGVEVDLIVFRDGEEALTHLLQCAENLSADPLDSAMLDGNELAKRSTLPHFILLDLNLPRISGFEVLKTLRETSLLDCVPVIVLSTSVHPEDVRRAYRLGASGYFEKPRELQQFIEVLHVLKRYWLEMALVPRF